MAHRVPVGGWTVCLFYTKKDKGESIMKKLFLTITLALLVLASACTSPSPTPSEVVNNPTPTPAVTPSPSPSAYTAEYVKVKAKDVQMYQLKLVNEQGQRVYLVATDQFTITIEEFFQQMGIGEERLCKDEALEKAPPKTSTENKSYYYVYLTSNEKTEKAESLNIGCYNILNYYKHDDRGMFYYQSSAVTLPDVG